MHLLLLREESGNRELVFKLLLDRNILRIFGHTRNLNWNFLLNYFIYLHSKVCPTFRSSIPEFYTLTPPPASEKVPLTQPGQGVWEHVPVCMYACVHTGVFKYASVYAQYV